MVSAKGRRENLAFPEPIHLRWRRAISVDVNGRDLSHVVGQCLPRIFVRLRVPSNYGRAERA